MVRLDAPPGELALKQRGEEAAAVAAGGTDDGDALVLTQAHHLDGEADRVMEHRTVLGLELFQIGVLDRMDLGDVWHAVHNLELLLGHVGGEHDVVYFFVERLTAQVLVAETGNEDGLHDFRRGL